MLFHAMAMLTVTLIATVVAMFSPSLLLANELDSKPAAKVNNSIIKQSTLDLLSQSRSNGPLSALKQNQNEILQDLITTELLNQAAKLKGTNLKPKHKIELELAQQTLLSQLYVKDFMDELDIQESELLAIYKATKDRVMVQMRYWDFSSKEEAIKFITDFSELSEAQLPPGNTDAWQAMDSLPYAHQAYQDIKQAGDWLTQAVQHKKRWRVGRCENYSTIKKPPFEHVKESIRQEIAQEKLQAHIKELRKSAIITIAERK